MQLLQASWLGMLLCPATEMKTHDVERTRNATRLARPRAPAQDNTHMHRHTPVLSLSAAPAQLLLERLLLLQHLEDRHRLHDDRPAEPEGEQPAVVWWRRVGLNSRQRF